MDGAGLLLLLLPFLLSFLPLLDESFVFLLLVPEQLSCLPCLFLPLLLLLGQNLLHFSSIFLYLGELLLDVLLLSIGRQLFRLHLELVAEHLV